MKVRFDIGPYITNRNDTIIVDIDVATFYATILLIECDNVAIRNEQ